jgi:hypothetical protein
MEILPQSLLQFTKRDKLMLGLFRVLTIIQVTPGTVAKLREHTKIAAQSIPTKG